MDDNALNDLIGSRICHDLISPLGAIGNGIELLSLTGAGASPEVALISQSIENANARIRYFRIAFGAASANAHLGEAEVRAVLRDNHKGGRLKVDWKATGDLPRCEVKLAFLAIQCLGSALPWGGAIRIHRTAGGDWSLHARGERLKFDKALWDMLSDPRTAISVTASEVHFALVRSTAARLKRALNVTQSDQSISISF